MNYLITLLVIAAVLTVGAFIADHVLPNHPNVERAIDRLFGVNDET